MITNKRAFFEGAKKTMANRDFATASDRPFEELARTDRDTMRARARWLSSNNPIMSNIDETIINNVVGRGMKLQADKKIEQRFNEWSMKCDLTGKLSFYDMQRVILNHRMVDGEIFIYKKIVNGELRLQLIEADQLDTYRGTSGMNIDTDGRVTEYYFKSGNSSVEISAEHIINYFKAQRASQYRGVSEYSRCIVDIKNMHGYVTALIESMRARSSIAYAVFGDEDPAAFGANDDGTLDTDEKLQYINSAFVAYLNGASKIEALDSSTTPVNLEEFIVNMIRLQAAGRNVSYELASRDYSKVNFTSGRMGRIDDNRRFDYEQSDIINYVLDDIFATWWSLESLSSVPDHNWIPPIREWVRPTEDLKVALDKIDNNLGAPEDAAKALGLDYEATLRRKKENIDLAKKILGEDYKTDSAAALERRRSKQEIGDIVIAVMAELQNKEEN